MPEDKANAGVEIPEVITPEQLAQHTGWSARRLRELARKIGALPHHRQPYGSDAG